MTGNTIALASEIGPGRQDPVAARQPQRRRPPLRQGRLSLRQRRRRRLRLRRRQRLRGRERRRARPARAGREDPAHHAARAASRRPTRSRAPGTARCNVTGRTDAPATSARRPSPGGCATRSASPSTRTRPATRFFINDVGQDAWEEIDLGIAGADYGWNVREGPCVNGSLTNCGPPPAGMTNPIYCLRPRESRLRLDHRRRLRAERGLAGRLRRHVPLRRLRLRQDLRAHAQRQRRLHAQRVRDRRRRRRQHDVRAVTAAGRRSTTRTTPTAARCGGSSRPPPANRPPTARVTASPDLGPGPAGRELRRQREHATPTRATRSPTSGTSATARRPQTTSSATTSHTYTTAGTFTATLTRARQPRRAVVPGLGAHRRRQHAARTVTIDTPDDGGALRGRPDDHPARHRDRRRGRRAAGVEPQLARASPPRHAHAPLPRADGRQRRADHDAGARGSRLRDDGYLEVLLTATDSRGVTTTVTRNVLPRKVDLTFATSPAGRTSSSPARRTPRRRRSRRGRAIRSRSMHRRRPTAPVRSGTSSRGRTAARRRTRS